MSGARARKKCLAVPMGVLKHKTFNTSEFPASEDGNKETLKEEEMTEQYWLHKLKAVTDNKCMN